MQGKEPWEGRHILCTWGLPSSSFKFLSIKILNWNVWTDVLPAVGNGCGRGSWNWELRLFDDLWVNRVEVYIGAQSVCVFVGWVSLSSSWSVFLTLYLSLCLTQALPWIFSDPLGPFPHEALMCVPRAWLTRKFQWQQQRNEEKRAGLWTKGLWAPSFCAYLSPSEC